MPCYYPQTVYRSKYGRDPETGRWPIVFNPSDGYTDMELQITCGQCIGCRLERSRQWAIRCYHESKLYDENMFVTLTYDDEHLVDRCGVYDEQYNDIVDYSLNKRDFVLFMKKLRKKYSDRKIKYLHCGEYGEKYGRPHHHAIIFNLDIGDKLYYKSVAGNKLYKSEKLEKIWQNGNCIIGEVTLQSAAYVARYITKKITGKKADAYYDGVQPEYITMSRREAIGKKYYEKHGENIRRTDSCVVDGMECRPPKYYDNIYDIIDKKGLERAKRRRTVEAKKLSDENTYDRLRVREHIKRVRTKCLLRNKTEED